MSGRVLNVLWHLDRTLLLIWHRARWIDRHHVPMHGPVILAANHTAGLDPFLIQGGCTRLIRWLMLQKYQFRVMNVMWKRIEPIGLTGGGADLASLRQIIKALKEGSMVGLFPEGAIQRGHRELQPFEPGIGMIALRSEATIVPTWISGTPVARSMIWHFLLPSRSVVVFGRAYRPDPNQSHEQVAEQLRQKMLALARRSRGEPDSQPVTSAAD
jgi:1-acyl-sn-glycerol-3-phosphate acyltransferase